jgi:hypothetical protein
VRFCGDGVVRETRKIQTERKRERRERERERERKRVGDK